jgi:hypothetical protein
VCFSTRGRADGATVLSGPLHTAGNKIYDASNQPVQLRGLERVILRATAVTENEIDHARQWGANIIRLTVSEDEWMHWCPVTSYNLGYAAGVDQVVNWVTSRGMVALVELIENPRFTCDPNSDSAQKMAAFPGSVIFWKNVAQHYKDNPLVAFDLYNEPHDITPDVWLRGGAVTDGLITWQAAGMQQLYDGVRSTGAQNLVFVSGYGWASNPPTTLVSGNNIVYAAHVYVCPHDPPPNCLTTTKVGPFGLVSLQTPVLNPYDPTPIMDRWTTLAGTSPLVVTEFGWPDSNSGTYNANLIAAANQRGWGWIAYAWPGSVNGKFNLLANWGADANYDPNPAGVPVKDGLSAPS